MTIRMRILGRLISIIVIGLMASCSTSSAGYIHIIDRESSLQDQYYRVLALIDEDERFSRMENLTKSGGEIEQNNYVYDPFPEHSETYRVKFYISARMNPSVGALAIFFTEFSVDELSPRGKAIFNQLVEKVSGEFPDSKLEWGTNSKRYMHLLTLF